MDGNELLATHKHRCKVVIQTDGRVGSPKVPREWVDMVKETR